MRLMELLFGPDVPAPEAGQVWECGWNGERFRVERVKVDCSGASSVYVSDWLPHGHWAMPQSKAKWCLMPREFVYGTDRRSILAKWKKRIREERRTLVIDQTD